MKLKKLLVLAAGLLVLANLSLAAEVSQDIELILDA